MKHISCNFHGISPLIMHSCQCVNPLHPISIELKKLTSKRNKTEEDLLAISNLEWESGLYWSDEVGLYIPPENIEACVREGGKALRKGKHIVKAFTCETMEPAVDIGEKRSKAELMADNRFRDVRMMTVMRARVMRTRPRFNTWNVSFIASYDENILDFNEVVNAIEYAGQYVGLCDSRPKYGKFVARIEELD